RDEHCQRRVARAESRRSERGDRPRARVRGHLRRLFLRCAVLRCALRRFLFAAVVQAASPARRATCPGTPRSGDCDSRECGACAPGARGDGGRGRAARTRRGSAALKAILLTSTFRRHNFVINTVNSNCDLVGVWQEEKSFRPERYAQNADDEAVIQKHFASRDESENQWFAEHEWVRLE